MKYIIYARVSPKGSDFDGETTISMQIQYCRDWIKMHGGEVCGELYDEFVSGKTMDRPNFNRIMEDLAKGTVEWDAIVCYKMSRLTRSLRDSVLIFEKLIAAGKSFVSVTEMIDLSTPAGRMHINILQTFAQFEREQTVENVKNKALSIAQRGEWPNGRPPFGYKRSGIRHDNVLQVDEAKAAIVRNIFAAYNAGIGIPTLARQYRGVLVKSQVSLMLRNPAYIGKILHKGHVFNGQHPPIIEPETYLKAQNQLAAPKEKPLSRPGAYKHYDFLLSGLLYCTCGKHLTAGTAQSGRYAYYTCTDPECRRRVSAPKIEARALDFIKELPTDDETIAATVAELKQRAAEQRERYRPDVERLMEAKEKMEAEKKKMIDILLGHNLHAAFVADLNTRMDALQTQIAAIESGLNAVKSMCYDESSIYEVAISFAQKLRSMQDAFINIPKKSLQMVCQQQIKKIVLQADGKHWMLYPAFGENSDKGLEWWA